MMYRDVEHECVRFVDALQRKLCDAHDLLGGLLVGMRDARDRKLETRLVLELHQRDDLVLRPGVNPFVSLVLMKRPLAI